jgi:serine/threonine protein kinase
MSERLGQQFGNYRLTRLLGKGGFADTYLGEHTYLKTFAAIKVLQAQLTQSDREAFYNEARTIASLRHPNIIRVLDFGVQDDIPFLVMDYASHGTLRQRHRRGETLPLSLVVTYVKQVAAALQYAHDQKIIHRDVKPENMLLGDVDEVLLGDFGVATIMLSTLSFNPQNVAGTVAYMAPEQIEGRPQPASDQYALGVVVYEWLTGVVPFRGTYSEVAVQHERVPPPPLRERLSTIPPDVEQVIFTSLAKDPRKRFGRIQAFANALEQASQTATRPAQAFSSTPPPPPGTPSPNDPQVYIPTEIGAHHSTPVLPGSEEIRQTSYGWQHAPYIAPPPPSSEQINLPSSPPPQGPLPTPRITPTVQPQQLAAQTGGIPAIMKPARSSPMKILVAVIALLVIIASSVLYYSAVYRPNQLHAEATATVVARVTGTARANATGTAQVVHATATAVSQATAAAAATQTALQNIYTQATTGSPVLSDPLSKADSYGWDDVQYKDPNNGKVLGSCSFSQGAYHDYVTPGFIQNCQASATNFSNLVYQVQVTIISGHSAGLMFRASTKDNAAGYVFRISTDGTYIFKKVVVNGNNYNHITLLSGNSSAIKAGINQTNLLAVVARGNTFYLYINNQYVGSASDSTFTSGEIGVYVESDTSSVEAYFNNAQVWRL